MIDGVTSRAFSTTTLPQEQFEKSFKEKIIEGSREKYGKLRKKVEREITYKLEGLVFIKTLYDFSFPL